MHQHSRSGLEAALHTFDCYARPSAVALQRPTYPSAANVAQSRPVCEQRALCSIQKGRFVCGTSLGQHEYRSSTYGQIRSRVYTTYMILRALLP
eukprot:450075-Pleurochrysis_carterae.AAC.14